MAAALLEILDHGGERFEGRHLGQPLAAPANQIDGGAGKEDETLRPAVRPPLAIVKATEDISGSMPLVTRTTSLSVPFHQ